MQSIRKNPKTNQTKGTNPGAIYTISVNVGDEIINDIHYFRGLLRREVASEFMAYQTEPNLPLMGFRLEQEYELDLIRNLGEFARSEKGFCINLRNFDQREWSNAIYTGISDYAGIAALFTRIKSALRKRLSFRQMESEKPSIAIGKWLDSDQYRKAKRLFATLEYANSFWVESFTLARLTSSGRMQPVGVFDMAG